MILIPRRNYGLNLFDELFNDPFFIGSTGKSGDSREFPVMRTDITEKDGNCIMEIELPGFKREDIKTGLKDGYLTTSAGHDVSDENRDNEGTVIHKECYTSSCKGTFFVGGHTRQEDTKVGFENGILKLWVPEDVPEIEKTPKHIDIL